MERWAEGVRWNTRCVILLATMAFMRACVPVSVAEVWWRWNDEPAAAEDDGVVGRQEQG